MATERPIRMPSCPRAPKTTVCFFHIINSGPTNPRLTTSTGAYHSGDPTGPVDQSLLSGCALAVADKDDIEQVGWDDLVVFSVNHECVKQRVTQFEVSDFRVCATVRQRLTSFEQIPSRMPACSGEKCICAW